MNPDYYCRRPHNSNTRTPFLLHCSFASSIVQYECGVMEKSAEMLLVSAVEDWVDGDGWVRENAIDPSFFGEENTAGSRMEIMQANVTE